MPLLVILLPLLDVFLFFGWLFSAPFWALLYGLAAAGLGWLLLRFAKIGFGEALSRGGGRASAFGGFAAAGLAGMLLIFPGYVSDIAAVAVLVAPFFIRLTPFPPGAGRSGAPPDEIKRRPPLEVDAEIAPSDSSPFSPDSADERKD